MRIPRIVESDGGFAREWNPEPIVVGLVGLEPSPPECRKRTENGWLNRKDMDELVKALRELKAW